MPDLPISQFPTSTPATNDLVPIVDVSATDEANPAGTTSVATVAQIRGTQISSHTQLTDIGTNTHDQIDAHLANTSNPHSVNKTQVGLGNVDNTSDAAKPVSTATQTALDAKAAANHNHDSAYEAKNSNIQSHIASTSNPHSVSKTQVGLGNVTNDAQVPLSQKGAVNGVAQLDADGKVPSAQLPAIAMTDVNVVASQADQLSLTAQEGDVCVRSDEDKTYIHNGGTAGTMADWTLMRTPSAANVSSVFGRTGSVAAQNNDYTASQVANVPAGNIAAATVQDALNELDTDKAAAVHTHSADAITDGSTNKAYTATEKTKLAGIAESANNYSHPATHSADIIVDGTTNKAYTAAEQTKLAGIATSATANAAATAAETTTGTDAAKFVTPDGLAGSVHGKRFLSVLFGDPNGSALTTGDGKGFFPPMPSEFNGWLIVGVIAGVTTVSSSGLPTYQLRNVTQSFDVLTTKASIDASKTSSLTAATPPVIDTASSHNVIATGNIYAVDKDVAGTGEKGDSLTIIIQAP